MQVHSFLVYPAYKCDRMEEVPKETSSFSVYFNATYRLHVYQKVLYFQSCLVDMVDCYLIDGKVYIKIFVLML